MRRALLAVLTLNACISTEPAPPNVPPRPSAAPVAQAPDASVVVVKKVKLGESVQVRPEVVCGTPKEERVIHVDVKTGNAS